MYSLFRRPNEDHNLSSVWFFEMRTAGPRYPDFQRFRWIHWEAQSKSEHGKRDALFRSCTNREIKRNTGDRSNGDGTRATDMLPRFTLTPRHAEFTPCRVLSYGVYRFLCLMKYFFALTIFDMNTNSRYEARVCLWNFLCQRRTFLVLFFFKWSRGKFRTFSFHEKYGAKYENIYLRTSTYISLIPLKYI